MVVRAQPIDTGPEAVQEMHARMYRRLRRQIDSHRDEISPEGWALLTRVAFALYVDSVSVDEITPLPAELQDARRARR